MSYMESYKTWLEGEQFDSQTKQELRAIEGNKEEIEDRFYQELEFGTAGLRGIVGAGTNRMNNYTVAKATQGLADYVHENSSNQVPKAVITYDSRKKSDEFAMITARVLAANGIKTYLFDGVRPTPETSFAVRYLKADTGVMITASHNPPEYNGYKAYGSDGAQYCTEDADKIVEKAKAVADYSQVKMISEREARESDLLLTASTEIDHAFISEIHKLTLNDDIDKGIKIVYSPMHGVGGESVLRILRERGFTHVSPVEEQLEPDGNFPTSNYPNPEAVEAFEYSIKKGKQVDADILIATDPDCDRVGLMARGRDGYVHFTGNQVGALLMDYIISTKSERNQLKENHVLVKTIVSNRFADEIAKKHGLKVHDTLTGFKNIARAMREMEAQGEDQYLFGYEESIGYLPETFVRDKDAVSATMLIAEMTGYYKKQGKSLLDRMEEIYSEYGYFEESLYSITMKGQEGRAKIEKLMNVFRDDYPKTIGSLEISEVMDFKEGLIKRADGSTEEIKLPKENVMKFIFAKDAWYAVRPSGTEPKIKFYVYSHSRDREVARSRVSCIKQKIQELVDSI